MVYNKEKYFIKSPEVNTINAKLDLIESYLAKIDGKPSPFVEKIFGYMDEIYAQVKSLRENNVEMVKIQTQLNYVSNRIYSSASVLIKSYGGIKALEETRNYRRVSEEQWWWYLDQYLKEKRKKDFRKAGKIGILGIATIAILLLIYNQFIAPPPEVRARMEYEDKIDDLIAVGDYAGAMNEITPALALTPDYYPLWIKKGVLANVLGDEQTEKASYEKAMQLSSTPEYFFYERANIFMQFGMYDEVLADADNLLEINPDSAEAFLFQGLVYETLGQMDDAFAAFEKAATLAEEQNKNQLVATIRVRMGMIMQSITIPTTDP